ncbi:methyltransferase [Saccharothrix syringae]|uniref:Methyltransferase n=2 Tax=Saccharothrix syringae TaxID=103733 RepID=A0A5Q0HD53_SACSY|nr:methyltransferase [Saccharothrix syringae]
MGLATSFWRFKALAVAVELRLFTVLDRAGGLTAAELADELGTGPRAADMFLASCASLGLLEERDGRYANSAVADRFLVEGREDYFGGFVRFCDTREYPGWGRLTDAVLTDRPTTWDPDVQDSPFAASDTAMLAGFWDALHVAARYTARELARVYDFRPHRALLDVGGGSGAFPIELCARHPALRASVYELAHVCPIAEDRVARAGLTGVVDAVAGDFLADGRLPAGYDVHLVSGVLHNWDPATNLALLRKCREALAPGGVLLVCELVLNDRRTGPPEAALMGLNMVVETVGGRNYAESEYVDWLDRAGFTGLEVRGLGGPGANAVVVAHR